MKFPAALDSTGLVVVRLAGTVDAVRSSDEHYTETCKVQRNPVACSGILLASRHPVSSYAA